MPVPSGPQRARQEQGLPNVEPVIVPTGVAGLSRLSDLLAERLAGHGSPIALIPQIGPLTPPAMAERITTALAPGMPSDNAEAIVVVSTSGSTGDPRGVLHSVRSLTSLTTAVHARVTGTPTWIAALPLTSMGGLNVLVRALATDRQPIALPSLGGAAPFQSRDLADAVAAATRPIAVSLVAAQLARLLDDVVGITALQACDLVLIGGGPLPAHLADRAADAGIAVTRTYGSTETSGGCVFNGEPLPSVQVTAGTDPAHPATIRLGGPMLALGYRHDAMGTARAFTPDGLITSDLGYLDDDGRLHVVGRSDDVVIVRGVNISLPAVAEVAGQGLPCVAVAIPQAAASSSTAGDPVIVVCIARGTGEPGSMRTDVDLGAVQRLVRERLGPPAVPRDILVVNDLPMLPNGKPDRALIAQWAQD